MYKTLICTIVILFCFESSNAMSEIDSLFSTCAKRDTLFLEKMLYAHSGNTIYVPDSTVLTVIGYSSEHTIIDLSEVDSSEVILLGEGSSVCFKNIQFIGDPERFHRVGTVNTKNSVTISISDCVFDGISIGGSLKNSKDSGFKGPITIVNSVVMNISAYFGAISIASDPKQGSTIQGIRIENCMIENVKNGSGIYLEDITDVTIKTNSIRNIAHEGIKIGGNKSQNFIISENMIGRCGEDAIDLYNGGRNVVVSGNIISNDAGGAIEAKFPSYEACVQIKKAGGWTISEKPETLHSEKIIITNNIIHSARGIQAYSKNTIVSNNYIEVFDFAVGLGGEFSSFTGNTVVKKSGESPMMRTAYLKHGMITNNIFVNNHLSSIERNKYLIKGSEYCFDNVIANNIFTGKDLGKGFYFPKKQNMVQKIDVEKK